MFLQTHIPIHACHNLRSRYTETFREIIAYRVFFLYKSKFYLEWILVLATGQKEEFTRMQRIVFGEKWEPQKENIET